MKARVINNTSVEFLITFMLALMCVFLYNFSPLVFTVGLIGFVATVAVLLKAPEYAVLFLVTILPFRDIHLVSALHFKRFVIWSLLLYLVMRYLTASKKAPGHKITPLHVFVCSFIAVIVVSLVKTASALYSNTTMTRDMLKSTIFSDALIVIEGLLILYIIYFFMTSLKHIEAILLVSFAVSGLIALLGILQYYADGIPAPFDFLFDPEYTFFGRATSVFSNPNILGEFLAPNISMMVFYLFRGDKRLATRFFFIVPMLLLDFWAIVLSFSRGSMLQCFFGVALGWYWYTTKVCRKRLSWKVLLMSIICSGLVLASLQFYDLYLQTRLSWNKADSNYAFELYRLQHNGDSFRLLAARKAAETFLKHPVFGIGYSLFSGASTAGFRYFGLAVHNQYLKILAEMGILGFIPFIGLLCFVLKTGLNQFNQPELHAQTNAHLMLALIVLIGMSAACCGFFFADGLFLLPIAGELWVFCGAILALDRLKASHA